MLAKNIPLVFSLLKVFRSDDDTKLIWNSDIMSISRLVSFSDELFISHIYDLHILLFILFIDIQHSDAGLAEMLSQFATGVTAVM